MSQHTPHGSFLDRITQELITTSALGSSVPTLDMQQALHLFTKLADDGSIAFAQARDGCHHRAHLMCDAIIQAGHAPLKAWAFEDKARGPLTATLPGGGEARWWFHVAPALQVALPIGRTEALVFDPTLFDTPVTLAEWGNLLNAPPELLQIAPYGQAPQGYKGNLCPDTNADANTSMLAWTLQSEQMMWDDMGPRKVYRGQLCHELARAGLISPPADRGRRWIALGDEPAPCPPPRGHAI